MTYKVRTPPKPMKKGDDKPSGSKSHTGRLSDIMARFVEEYMIDSNGTQAVIRAGYKSAAPSVRAAKLMNSPIVADAIRAAQAKLSKKLDLSAEMVLGELKRIAFSDIRKAVSWKTEMMDDGREAASIRFHDSDLLDDHTAAAIAEVGTDAKGNLKIKFHDKPAALVNLGKHLGLFTERVEVTQPIRFIIEGAPPIKYE